MSVHYQKKRLREHITGDRTRENALTFHQILSTNLDLFVD